MGEITARDTKCCAKCKAIHQICALRWHCTCHTRAVERATTTRRERTIRASLRGLNDPEWTGEER